MKYPSIQVGKCKEPGTTRPIMFRFFKYALDFHLVKGQMGISFTFLCCETSSQSDKESETAPSNCSVIKEVTFCLVPSAENSMRKDFRTALLASTKWLHTSTPNVEAGVIFRKHIVGQNQAHI